MPAEPVSGTILGLGLLKKVAGFGLLKKIFGGITFNKILTGAWINQLTGNPIGALVDKLAGKTTTKKENLNLNNRLLNLTGKDKENAPTQEGALRFLGDRSGRLDDAPDIEATNQSVLDNIAKNQSLALGTTVAPDLDTKQSVVDSFSGLVGIIQQINNNIGAIGQAMLNSSVIESKYRQELIDDLEEEIAEKGKTRSRTRFERSIFNFATRQKNKIATKTGNLSKDLSKALLLSLGLELGDLPFGGFNKEDDSEKEPNIIEQNMEAKIETLETSTKKLKESGIDQGTSQIMVEETALPNVDGQSSLEGINPPYSSSIPGIDDNFQGNSLLFFLMNKDIEKKLKKKKEMSNIPVEEGNAVINGKEINPEFNKEINDENPDLSQNIENNKFKFFQNINPETSIAYSPLESIGGGFQIIDMRTAKEIVGDTGSSDPTTVLDSSVSSKDPSRRTSPYEGLVRD